MLWGKKKKLLRELLFFYAMVNTNVYMAQMLKDDPKTKKTFTNIVSNLTNCLGELLMKTYTVEDIQKMVIRETELKSLWTTRSEQIAALQKQNPPPEVENTDANYYS